MGSDRPFALEHKPVQVAHLAYWIISVRLVQQTAIVPDHDVARLPFMTILEFLLRRMFEKFVEQRQSLRLRHSDDLFNANGIDVKRLATRFRMRPDQRVHDRLGSDSFSLFGELRKFPLAVSALVDVARLKVVD